MSAGRNRQLSFDDRIRQLEKEAAEVRQNIKRISKRKKHTLRSEPEPVREEAPVDPVLSHEPEPSPVVSQYEHIRDSDDLFSLSSSAPYPKTALPDAHEDEYDDTPDASESEDVLLDDEQDEKMPGPAGPHTRVSGRPATSSFKMDEKFAGYLASGSFMPMGRREPDPGTMRNKAIFLLIVLGVVAYIVYWLVKVL